MAKKNLDVEAASAGQKQLWQGLSPPDEVQAATEISVETQGEDKGEAITQIVSEIDSSDTPANSPEVKRSIGDGILSAAKKDVEIRKGKGKTFSIYLEYDDVDALDWIADTNSVKRSNLVQQAVKMFLSTMPEPPKKRRKPRNK